MATWSQAHFMQALGWATLNSLWQTGIVWCLVFILKNLFKLGPAVRYRLSALAVLGSFAWFVITFLSFYFGEITTSLAIFDTNITNTNSLLNIVLYSASLTYILLLIFPSVRLFLNWKNVGRIRVTGIRKVDPVLKVFVQRIRLQLGIKRNVMVYISSMVNTPLTIGFLKPVILLPVAVMNNLSLAQVEAILLHELSHIKRFDYILNLGLCIISTAMYYNPFIKMLMNQVELERENCCDEMVLQFGYDKMGYASALLTLEKHSSPTPALALNATGRNFLLKRIETIIGMEKKQGVSKSQIGAIVAALLCIVIFNSVLIIRESKNTTNAGYAFQDITSPLNFIGTESSLSGVASSGNQSNPRKNKGVKTGAESTPFTVQDFAKMETELPENLQLRFASEDAIDAQLSPAAKQKICETVHTTKKLVQSEQWKEVEISIADAMNSNEKEQAKEQYLAAEDQKDYWKNLEQNLKSQYNNLDWVTIDQNLLKAKSYIELDSLQQVYSQALAAYDQAYSQLQESAKNLRNPAPDQSIEAIKKYRLQMSKQLRVLDSLRAPKKVVDL